MHPQLMLKQTSYSLKVRHARGSQQRFRAVFRQQMVALLGSISYLPLHSLASLTIFLASSRNRGCSMQMQTAESAIADTRPLKPPPVCQESLVKLSAYAEGLLFIGAGPAKGGWEAAFGPLKPKAAEQRKQHTDAGEHLPKVEDLWDAPSHVLPAPSVLVGASLEALLGEAA